MLDPLLALGGALVVKLAIDVLVVACPCALVLAPPTAVLLSSLYMAVVRPLCTAELDPFGKLVLASS